MESFQDRIQKIERVSDMLCTAHAGLGDKYARWALWLDIIILGSSTWLVALVFVEPRINVILTPLGLDPQIWIGTLGILTFFLTVLGMKTDWNGKSDAHHLSLSMYARIKRECGHLLSSGAGPTEYQRLFDRYDLVNEVAAHVPEQEFLRQKKRHKTKIVISKHLDSHPGASILLTRFRLWYRDNFGSQRGQNP
jgi:hypothetical protein